MSESLNVRVVETMELPTPDRVRQEYPAATAAINTVIEARRAISALLNGSDSRPLVVVGPCSVHDPETALEYAHRLAPLCDSLRERLLIVMRVYFEKPRTTVGWKGFINDPHLDGSENIATGLRRARELLAQIAALGIPAATEFLDPIVPQYTADLVSWAAIGARTTESQTHREMASGLSMPVGFKNGTDGTFDVAVNAMLAAARPHSFLGIDGSGRVSVIRTAGNPDGHLVLRGGSRGPNYRREDVEQASARLRQVGLFPKVLVDCAHGNSGKDARQQVVVAREVAHQLASGSPILGIMLESNLKAGRQDLGDRSCLAPGVSITDPCIDFEATEALLTSFADASPERYFKTA
jgi:3-deoxy-7-phosphoheptulonate synthase